MEGPASPTPTGVGAAPPAAVPDPTTEALAQALAELTGRVGSLEDGQQAAFAPINNYSINDKGETVQPEKEGEGTKPAEEFEPESEAETNLITKKYAAPVTAKAKLFMGTIELSGGTDAEIEIAVEVNGSTISVEELYNGVPTEVGDVAKPFIRVKRFLVIPVPAGQTLELTLVKATGVGENAPTASFTPFASWDLE